MKRRNQFLFVLGPHRSGTSLVANALHTLGVNLGSRFIEPNDDNPKGFFEDEEIVQFNDRLLRSMSLSWDCFGFIWAEDFTAKRFKPYHKVAVAMIRQRFSESRVAGLKYPRFCILFPLWKSVISEALDVEVWYVMGIRDPEQCVLSQKTRHLKDSDFHLMGKRNVQTLLLWWTYLTKALAEIDPKQLVVVNYLSLLESPELELQRLAGLLEFDLSQQAVESFSRDHVEPLLNRSQNQGKVSRTQSPQAWEFADTLYKRLLTLSCGGPIQSEVFAGILEGLDIQALEPVYLRELQYMNGYSYKKIISLRHRLIQTIHEISDQRAKLGTMQIDFDVLLDQHQALTKEYQVLRTDHQTVLNTKGWRLLTFLRRWATWPFR